MGVGPIPNSAIVRQAVWLGLDADEFALFRSVIRTMDAVYRDDVDARKGTGKAPSVSSQPLTPALLLGLWGKEQAE